MGDASDQGKHERGGAKMSDFETVCCVVVIFAALYYLLMAT